MTNNWEGLTGKMIEKPSSDKVLNQLLISLFLFFLGAGVGFVISYTGFSFGIKWLQVVGFFIGAFFILLFALTWLIGLPLNFLAMGKMISRVVRFILNIRG